ncbi:RNA polymerase sigma factor [Cohnella thailandensis]|uniref:Sigma-70 family RNA polymerase sigma factor n=1 Tax=Cohnella thailandensis TaxID=557557 RepID=A0A841T5W3_9BACL|nr:sigma-70 family RNA polymerase sigma factor [Cohnella thailandensis]MBB6637257.1 sigma-70 family RNA polymerase sigma factor [Cohnella thailandensis]MBP1976932.1 RNA polymerase sigma-70 factor (ECF subfamily) [Cohnella thailandensis]
MDNFSPEQTGAFAELYGRNADTVYRLCYLLLRNSADADDAVQSIFLKVLKDNRTFNDREHERAWLIVAAKNHCKDMLKSWWRSRRVDVKELPEAKHWDDREQSELLSKLLLLPEKYKTVLYLYYYEGYSVRELAGLLKRKESTIQTQLAKGRERLRQEIGGDWIGRTRSEGTV